MPLAANTNLLSVNFSLAGAKIDDPALESLKAVSEQILTLNLANTSVTDAGLKVLTGMKNLRRLHLEKTAVGDEGLAALKGSASCSPSTCTRRKSRTRDWRTWPVSRS